MSPAPRAQGNSSADDDSLSWAAKWLTGIFAVVTAAAGLLGAVGGGLERILRNSPREWFILCFVLLVGAIACGVLVEGVLRKSVRVRWSVLAIVSGIVLFVSGVIGFALLAVNSRAAKDRPRITASLTVVERRIVVEGTVRAGGLKSEEHILLRVEGRNSISALAAKHAGPPRLHEPGNIDELTDDYFQLLYASRTGPDPDGNVDVTFKFPISPRLYERIEVSAFLITGVEVEQARIEPATGATTKSETETNTPGQVAQGQPQPPRVRRPCDVATRTAACVSLLVPQTSDRPQMTAAWQAPLTSPPVLALAIKMGETNPADVVRVEVRELRADGRLGPRLYAALLAPDGAGAFDGSVMVPISSDAPRICVTAQALSPGARQSGGGCRLTGDRVTVAKLRVPGTAT